MSDRDEIGSTGPAGPPDREPVRTGATGRAQEPKPSEAPQSAAEAAEREQDRQLAEGTENPG